MSDLDTSSFLTSLTEAFDFRAMNLKLTTRFRELVEWDSMVSVSIVAMVYANYQVQISGDELVSIQTLDELKSLIETKLARAA